MLSNSFKTVSTGKELLETLQGMSEEELALPLVRICDEFHDYGPFFERVESVEISKNTIGGLRGPYEWSICVK